MGVCMPKQAPAQQYPAAAPAAAPVTYPALSAGRVVFLKAHSTNQHLRIVPGSHGATIDGRGGPGEFAKWRIQRSGNSVLFMNMQTKQFLRVHPDGRLDGQGQGGALCHFHPHHHRPGVFSFRSNNGGHVGILPTGVSKNAMATGTGRDGQFTVDQVAGGVVPAVAVVSPAHTKVQPVVVSPTVPKGAVLSKYPVLSAGHVLTLRCHATRQNVRVVPGSNGRNLDAKGAEGEFALWTAEHHHGRLALCNRHTKRFLRIHPNGTADALGEGGPLCHFDIIFHRAGVFGFRRDVGKLGFTRTGAHENAIRGGNGSHSTFDVAQVHLAGGHKGAAVAVGVAAGVTAAAVVHNANSQPAAVVVKPAPKPAVVVVKPKPAVVVQPKPAAVVVVKPKPAAVVVKPKPAVVVKPKPAVVVQPKPHATAVVAPRAGVAVVKGPGGNTAVVKKNKKKKGRGRRR